MHEQVTSHRTHTERGCQELGAVAETTGTMLGLVLLSRPSPKPVSFVPLAAQGEPREKSERKYLEMQPQDESYSKLAMDT